MTLIKRKKEKINKKAKEKLKRTKKRHKTFKDLAERDKTSMGWFFGFKLHLIINNKGELINFKLTKGNVSDNTVIEDLIRYNRPPA